MKLQIEKLGYKNMTDASWVYREFKNDWTCYVKVINSVPYLFSIYEGSKYIVKSAYWESFCRFDIIVSDQRIGDQNNYLQIWYSQGQKDTYFLFHYTDDLYTFVLELHWKQLREKFIPVITTLSHLSAHELVCIFDEMFPSTEYIPLYKKWNVITTVKHFH